MLYYIRLFYIIIIASPLLSLLLYFNFYFRLAITFNFTFQKVDIIASHLLLHFIFIFFNTFPQDLSCQNQQ